MPVVLVLLAWGVGVEGASTTQSLLFVGPTFVSSLIPHLERNGRRRQSCLPTTPVRRSSRCIRRLGRKRFVRMRFR